jgi:hypothetical protein
VETVHRNIKELDYFLEHLNEKFDVEVQNIYYLVDEVKREGFEVMGQEKVEKNQLVKLTKLYLTLCLK